MKKLLSIISAGMLAIMAVSCVQEDLRIFDPSKATAPVLQSYTLDDKGLTASFTPGSFNMGFNDKVPVNHTLILVSADGKAVNRNVSATVDGGTISASASTISKLLTGMGYLEGDNVSLELLIRAMMQGTVDNGRGNGSIDSKDHISGNFVVTVPKGNPWADYTETSPWGVTGSIASVGFSWDKDIAMFMTSDGNKHVARNVKLATSDQFKFRKEGGWTENFGAEGDVEPFVLSLDTEYSAAAGGKNLAVPADGNYDLLLDTQAGTFTLSEAFITYPGFDDPSTWGVTGSIASEEINWDVDVTMTTDGEWHVAEGVVLTTGDQFKFRNDRKWTENFGAAGDVEPFVVTLDTDLEAVANGKNLAVPADGTYDLLVNPTAGLYKVVESLGGKSPVDRGEPEPEPEPEPITGWNIIGLNGNWNDDILATQNGNVWTAYITAEGDTEFKWRKDGGWDENFGIESGASYTLGEPFAAVAGGDNIQIGAGFWKVVLDAEAQTITISNGDVWSLIGDFNGWAGDIDMELIDGKWVSPVAHLNANGFKIRHNHDWSESVGGTFVEFRTPFPVGDENIMLPAEGDFIVTYDPAAGTITVEKSISGWNVIGLNGNWSDDLLAAENNGVWTVRVNVEADTEFKWRKDGGWDNNYGGDFVALGEPFAAVPGGNNVKLAPGYWLLTLDLSGAEPTLMVSDGTVWSLIGAFNDWSGDVDMVFADGIWTSPETPISGDFKIRKNHGWDENRGGVMESLGEEFDAEPGGADINVPEGVYVVYYYPESEKIIVASAKKVWSVIGDFNSWSADAEMVEVAPGIWMSDMLEIADGGWKVRFDHGWDVNRGGATTEQVGQFVGAVPGGDNIGLHGTFKVVYNANNETIGTLGWGVVGSIASIDGFSWNNDIPMNLASDGKWYSVPVALKTTDEIKIRWDAGWDNNRGGDIAEVGAEFEAVAGGNNMKVPADGTYMVVYDPENEKLTVTTAFWGLIGDFNSWGGDVFMMFDGANWVAYNQTLAGGWKIRQGCGWDVNRGGTFTEAGAAFDAVGGGDNINVGDLTNFAIIYDPANEKITVK